MIFTDEALELAPWSISKAKTSIQCPWKFEKQYIEKLRIPPEETHDISDRSLRVGSAVHKYAEEIAKKADPEKAKNLAISDNHLVSDEIEEFEAMIDNVHHLEDRISKFKTKHTVTKDLIEFKLGVNSDLTPADFWDRGVFFRGVIDRTLLVNDVHAVMIDIKSSKFPTLKYSQQQLAAYSLMMFCVFPKLEMVHPALYFVPSGRLLWGDKIWKSKIELNEDYSTVAYINDAASRARSDEIVPGKYCSWCVYKNICLVERKTRREKA